jgi:Alcohol dehydrogenase GroES-like domain
MGGVMATLAGANVALSIRGLAATSRHAWLVVQSQELTGSRPNATSVCRCHGPNGPCLTEQAHERADPTIGRQSSKGSPVISARGHATQGPLRAFTFERDEPRERDVQIRVPFCGVCHSDIHQAKDEWSNTVYPCVPGHEVVGRVTKIGAGVTTHAVGDISVTPAPSPSVRRAR